MRSVVGILMMSLLVAGCGGGSLFGSSSSSSESEAGAGDFTGPIADFFATYAGSKPQRSAGAEQASDEVDCPAVTVREGASTLSAYAPGDPSPMKLRYQGTIGRIARQCTVVGKTLQMKVGVEGRIIIGPAGAPGKVDVPLRFAVVREGPQPQTIVTKTYRLEVTIPPGDSNVPFVQIDEALTFPMPSSVVDLHNYVVYVGYDPEMLAKPRPQRRRAGPRRG